MRKWGLRYTIAVQVRQGDVHISIRRNNRADRCSWTRNDEEEHREQRLEKKGGHIIMEGRRNTSQNLIVFFFTCDFFTVCVSYVLVAIFPYASCMPHVCLPSLIHSISSLLLITSTSLCVSLWVLTSRASVIQSFILTEYCQRKEGECEATSSPWLSKSSTITMLCLHSVVGGTHYDFSCWWVCVPERQCLIL